MLIIKEFRISFKNTYIMIELVNVFNDLFSFSLIQKTFDKIKDTWITSWNPTDTRVPKHVQNNAFIVKLFSE